VVKNLKECIGKISMQYVLYKSTYAQCSGSIHNVFPFRHLFIIHRVMFLHYWKLVNMIIKFTVKTINLPLWKFVINIKCLSQK